MKNLKFLCLLCFGLFLSVNTIQAQAKKSCSQPCTKATSAKADNSSSSAVVMTVGEQTEKGAVNCDPKDCPPGCDISKCKKGGATGAAATKVSDTGVMPKAACSQKVKAAAPTEQTKVTPTKVAMKE